MANPLIYILLFFSSVFLLLFKLYSFSRPTTTKNLPPSPPKLPIIGNLHQIGPLIHRSLFSLSQRYGSDLMLLHMGSVPTLVVSSPDSAREIMQTHDLKFASRAPLYIYKTLFYDSKDLASAPYGEYWRQAKKITVHHYLSNNKLKSFSGLMDQETAITMRNIENFTACNKGVISLGDLFSQHLSNVLYKATFGKMHDDEETEKKFKMVSKDISKVFSSFYLVNFIPQLACIDVIRGAPSKVKALAKNINKLLEVVIEEKLAKMDIQKVDDHELGEGVEPVIDALLRLHKDGGIGFSLERDAVKALLMDSYFAGLDSTSALIEWVMAELLTHPSALKKLQAEVRMIVNGRQHITGDDIEQMKYLKAVIMETLRLHPSFPIPFPQVAMHDVNVMGFDIAKGTRIYINLWAIGRDPKVWDRPNEFVPERFVGGSMDFVKHDFKLLPFGAGRRSCPGEGLALTIAENLLANLLCKFDWALPEGVKEDDIDMNETTELATYKKSQLLAFAKPLSL